MHTDGGWSDFCYDNCCFLAARKKAQTIRHNIPELRSLPNLVCAHMHNEDDLRPYSLDGRTKYASTEEAEYPAALVFTLAVACTFWAASQGYAIIRIPRLPPLQCSGDRRCWTAWEASTFRQDAMVPMAISLGLKPSSAPGLPVRGHVADYFDQGTGLQVGVVYAGHGHFRHRLSPTKWENPFVVGRDGTHVDTVFKYIMGWDRMQLDGALDELTSKIIVCDCPTNSFCHVDVIIAKWFDRSHRPRRSRRAASPPLEPSCWQGSGLSVQFPKLSVRQLLWQRSRVSFPCWISKVLSGLCWKI